MKEQNKFNYMKLKRIQNRIEIFEYLYKVSEQNICTDTILLVNIK